MIIKTLFFLIFFFIHPIAGQENIVRVENHKGFPTLMINEKLDGGMTYMPKEGKFRDFDKAGIMLPRKSVMFFIGTEQQWKDAFSCSKK